MGFVRIMKRGGDDYYEYKKALKMAKKSIETLCELTEDMEDEYSERGGMSRREYEEDDMSERRYRR
jgi:hypothetical protein